MNTIEGVHLIPQKIIEREKGNIMHILKNSDNEYFQFGEAYFTFVKYKEIKGWKKHSRMVLNLVVPVGEIKLVLFDNRLNSNTKGQIVEYTLSRGNYCRLTIPSNVWFAFQGIGKDENILLNIANIEHDPKETEELEIENSLIDYRNWI